MLDKVTGLPRGFAFVVFETVASLEKVINDTTHRIDGKWVEVKRAVPLPVVNPPAVTAGAICPTPAGATVPPSNDMDVGSVDTAVDNPAVTSSAAPDIAEIDQDAQGVPPVARRPFTERSVPQLGGFLSGSVNTFDDEGAADGADIGGYDPFAA